MPKTVLFHSEGGIYRLSRRAAIDFLEKVASGENPSLPESARFLGWARRIIDITVEEAQDMITDIKGEG